jgi:hypothetical protein
MKKIALVSVAAVATLAVQLGGIGSAFAAEPSAPDQAPAATKGSASPATVQDSWCEQGGLGTSKASATCYNYSDVGRYAHFHVDCWAWGDADTDQTKWVGAWGQVGFYHGCFSHAQGIESYFY